MGSDFTYADMDGAANKDYDFKLIKSVKDKEGEYWVIEATPKTEKEKLRSGYFKTTHFVRKDINYITRSIFFLNDNATIKFFKITKLKKLNNILIPTHTIMLSKKAGSSA